MEEVFEEGLIDPFSIFILNIVYYLIKPSKWMEVCLGFLFNQVSGTTEEACFVATTVKTERRYIKNVQKIKKVN